MNCKKSLILVSLYWLMLIGSIIAFNQYVLLTGTHVLLRTVPVDPHSLFRGDFVILSYEINRIELDSIKVDFRDIAQLNRNESVYVALSIDNGYASAAAISSKPPKDTLFIKGTTSNKTDTVIEIDYGIETFFVPEGQGKTLEQKMGDSLEVKVAIDRFGNAVIHSLYSDEAPITFINQ